MKEVFEQLKFHLMEGIPCVLVSAIGGEGSAPRKTEAHMLVDAHGRVCGTVGGGAVEGKSIEFAGELLARMESAERTFELYEHASEDIGMICGGRVRVHFRYIPLNEQQMMCVAEAALAAFEEGIDAWLIIELSRHDVVLYSRGRLAGAAVPGQILSELDCLPIEREFGNRAYYAEQLVRGDRVYIFGGGHVAQALVPVLASVDFRCVVIEDRAEFCQKELFPQAQDVLLLEEKDWENALQIGCEDCICIMTRGHKNDLACQAFALKTQARYIGVIGSRRKIAMVNAQLARLGFADEDIARIVTPIGLDIGAVTPAEIAVSIAAQMIAHRAYSRKQGIRKSCMA